MYPYISIFGLQISSYGLMLTLSVLIACTMSVINAKQQKLIPEDILIIGAIALAFGLFCSKVLYILVTPSVRSELLSGNLNVLTDGGLVFYGGLIGGIIGSILGASITKTRIKHIEYCIIPFIPLAHSIGRVGCFLAGCCYGCAYDGAFAVYYPSSVAGISSLQGYFPIQIVEAIWNLITFVLLLYIRNKAKKPFGLLSLYLLLYAVGRFILEFFRGDAVRGIYLGFSVSQWISICIIDICLIWLIISIIQKKKTPHTF